ncbi:hypothetical protein V8F20_006643 [Naviculisporaceae sp. PSN 640]
MVGLRLSMCATLCAAVTIVSAADITGLPRTCDDQWISIVDKEDIDFYKTCKVIDGLGFFIGHDFTGPFEMPGVESIPRFSSGYLLPKLRGSDRVDDGVTSVSMPDVKNITQQGFLIGYVDYVTSVSFPKLESIVGDVVIVDSSNITNITFPSLETVHGAVMLEGSFEVINLPSLRSVKYLRIRSYSSKLDCPALGKELGPRLNLTLGEDDIHLGSGYEGFTCRGGGQTNDNWYNLTEALAGGPSDGSGEGGNDKDNGAGAGDNNSGAGVLSVGYGLGTALLIAGVMFI